MAFTNSIQKALGDFEILRELGRGGMGVVYEARQKSLNRRVALKVLASSLGLSANAVMRFQREAEAAAKLHHTNIVPIYFTGEEDGVYFYAMELIDGPSLDQVIRHMRAGCEFETSQHVFEEPSDVRSEPLPDWVNETIIYELPNGTSSAATASSSPKDTTPGSGVATGVKYFDRVATMIADVADALQHAHDHGVISRDIKPSNLLLGSDGRLSVSDFGLALVLEQPGMTMSGEFVGTPRYMSPEQISAGRAPLDHRTDIYSLGATLYELLTLQPPFTGQSRDEVIGQILHKEPRPPRAINRRIPIDLETICLKAIERDPDRRYQNASQLSGDLRAYVNRHAISARRLGPIGRGVKFARRNPLAVGFAFFVLLTVLSVGIGFKIVQDHERKAKLADLQDELIDDVFRGVTKDADDLIKRAIELDASDKQLEFMRGIQDFFQQNYDEATTHFDTVLEIDPDHIPAKSLRAVATHHQGDEYGYFKEIQQIETNDVRSFEENFFLGFAHSWGDPVLAESLLNEANEEEPNHLYVTFLRGMARRNIAIAVDLEVVDAKKHIDQAYEDITTAAKSIRTPLVLRELTWVRIDRVKIYREYIASGKSGSEKLDAKIEEILDAARADLDELLTPEHQDHEDTQYAVITLLVYLGNEEANRLRELTDSWLEDGRPVQIYTAQATALHFAALKDYPRAKQWTDRFTGRAVRNSKFVRLLVDLLADDIPFKSLQVDARKNVNDKLESGETEYIAFDLLFLYLFGVDELERYADDRIDQLIMGGELYAPHMKYFSTAPRRQTARDKMLSECRTGPAPHVALMHANFALGMEALAEGRMDAEYYFNQVQTSRHHLMYVHMMSRAILEHKQHWNDWLQSRSELLEAASAQ